MFIKLISIVVVTAIILGFLLFLIIGRRNQHQLSNSFVQILEELNLEETNISEASEMQISKLAEFDKGLVSLKIDKSYKISPISNIHILRKLSGPTSSGTSTFYYMVLENTKTNEYKAIEVSNGISKSEVEKEIDSWNRAE